MAKPRHSRWTYRWWVKMFNNRYSCKHPQDKRQHNKAKEDMRKSN